MRADAAPVALEAVDEQGRRVVVLGPQPADRHGRMDHDRAPLVRVKPVDSAAQYGWLKPWHELRPL